MSSDGGRFDRSLSDFRLSGTAGLLLSRGFSGVEGRRPEGAPAMNEATLVEAKELLRNPKFVALWIATWACLLLAIENIVTKINLLMSLGQ
jgi:hypothetical protein